MTHEYSAEMQDYISERIKTIQDKIVKAQHTKDSAVIDYCKGQLQELVEIRHYLSTKVDLDTQRYY